MAEDKRPYRLYEHTFVNGERTVVLNRIGDTPCRAKKAAFTALEAEIKVKRREDPTFPAQGWRLLRQRDITVSLPKTV